MPWLLNRISFSAAIIAASVMVHIGFIGAIVFAERRGLPPSELKAIDVDLVKAEDFEPKKEASPKPPEPPEQAERKPPEPAQSEPPNSPAETAKATPEERSEPPPPPQKQAARPDVTPGGPPSEGKSKLTPEEIAALRAQIQKCWKLPVGIPGVMGLEVVIRVGLGSKGQLAGEPVLLQAPAHERGPLLVGLAMSALKACYPFKLPPAKYADWKTLDLKFTATGMAGIAPPPKNLPKRT